MYPRRLTSLLVVALTAIITTCDDPQRMTAPSATIAEASGQTGDVLPSGYRRVTLRPLVAGGHTIALGINNKRQIVGQSAASV